LFAANAIQPVGERNSMSTEIVKQEQPLEVTPMAMLQLAISKGTDMDQLSKLMDMHDRWNAASAKRAFIQAMSEFKLEAISITKDKDNKQYGSKYTSIGNLVNTVTPILSKYGFSASWDLDQTAGIKVSCVMTHAEGHSESKNITVPLDTSGAKNPLQQLKSSITYARILTFEMACGLASKEANADDDGNGSSNTKVKTLDTEEFERLCGLIEAAETLDKLKVVYLSACNAAKTLDDQASIATFAKVKNIRYKELA
jgi:hypothetical protein